MKISSPNYDDNLKMKFRLDRLACSSFTWWSLCALRPSSTGFFRQSLWLEFWRSSSLLLLFMFLLCLSFHLFVGEELWASELLLPSLTNVVALKSRFQMAWQFDNYCGNCYCKYTLILRVILIVIPTIFHFFCWLKVFSNNWRQKLLLLRLWIGNFSST